MPNFLFQKIQKLTLALYRVTDCFPQDEILKRQMRKIVSDLLLSFNAEIEAANNIAANEFISASQLLTSFVLTKKGKDDIIDKVSKLRALFLIAREQNWVDFKNFDFLDNYCGEIIREVIIQKDFELLKQQKSRQGNQELIFKQDDFNQKSAVVGTLAKIEKEIKLKKLSDRQKEILDVVSKKERTRFSDFQSNFAGISERSLRRDLQNLHSKGLIKKNGIGRLIFYTK